LGEAVAGIVIFAWLCFAAYATSYRPVDASNKRRRIQSPY